MSKNRARLRIVSSQPEPTERRASRRGKTRERVANKLRGQGDELAVAKMAAFARKLTAKTQGQAVLMGAIRQYDLTVCLGPAGSGKTHIAVCEALEWQAAAPGRRIVLVRSAVEAGERLGFLPGGPLDKMEPYMRPYFDAMLTKMPYPRINALIAEGVIEVAPLAYMRGRNLSDCFVILDEAQNASRVQLKMLLTRFCQGSKFVVTADPDPWQCDVSPGASGLAETVAKLDAGGFPIIRMTDDDVVRHPIVKAILKLL